MDNSYTTKNIAQFYELKDNNSIDRIVEHIIAERVKQIDEFTIKELYEAYKDTEVSKIFVIDMNNFEKFLLKYLPIYLQEERNSKK